jgi:hypothetical protein
MQKFLLKIITNIYIVHIISKEVEVPKRKDFLIEIINKIINNLLKYFYSIVFIEIFLFNTFY